VAKLVVNNSLLQCNQGVAPSPLTVIPTGPPVNAMNQFVATIMDFKPMVNIKTFGMCNSTANPAVIAATAAAQGVKTPAPCVPATSSPWTPGSVKVSIGAFKALTDNSKCMCMWAGQISVQMTPNQTVDAT
jgi:Domain of unknown function (DUF4280)